MKEIRLYFEGDKALRPAFKKFFGELITAANGVGIQFECIAAGRAPESDYRKALRSHPEAWIVLLRDSEEPLGQERLERCGKLGVPLENVFWMVELMESWFLADPEAFTRVFGQSVNIRPLGNTADVESLSKQEVLGRITRALEPIGKGDYVRRGKTRDAPDILKSLDPALVTKKAPNCKRLFDAVHARLREIALPLTEC